MNTNELIASMKETPIHQDEAFRAFCQHPLAPQIFREICAGRFEDGGKNMQLVERSIYLKMVEDFAYDPWATQA